MSRLINIDDRRNYYIGMHGEYEQWNIDPNVLAEAQPEPKWILCSEGLPEENTPVLLGVKFKDDFKYFVTARMDYNYWTGLGRDIRGKLAWMPLPEPYQEERRADDER